MSCNHGVGKWPYILDDDWFKENPKTGFSDSFEQLCAAKQQAHP
ncbi:MAG TPA: hypothetical protein VKM94_10845 [Blastocatellia bacterium]|nr:hypothetical protein [Blastocatellia bacterium]